ncbi:MAG: hypothetical protein JJ992_04035 [Planctomycetes bacterium]|nr:hypothetical protein [Planctomycetota bacterium]
MVRIIKAAEVRESRTPPDRPEGSFVDVSHEVRRQLQRASEEAERILDEARAQSERIRHEAERSGRERGDLAFETCVAAEVQRRLETVVPALQQAAELVQASRIGQLKQGESAVLRLASAIAERLVRRELQQRPEIALDLVREALELATGSRQLKIRLNPTDFRSLGDRAADLARLQGDGVAAEVIADAAVSRGGCIVQTEFGTIDQRFESQLARMMEELT